MTERFGGNTTGRAMSASRPMAVREAPRTKDFSIPVIKVPDMRPGSADSIRLNNNRARAGFVYTKESPVKPNRFMETTWSSAKKSGVQSVTGDRFVRNYKPNEFRIEARNKVKPEKVNPNSKFAAERRNRTQERNLPKNREVVLFRKRLGDRVKTENKFQKLDGNGKARLELLRKLRQERKAQLTNSEQSKNFYNFKDTFRKGENMEMRPFIRQPEKKVQPRPNEVGAAVAPTVDQSLQSIRRELANIKGTTANSPEIKPKVAMATYWEKNPAQKLRTKLTRERLLAAATKTATRIIELQKKSAQPSVENKPLQRTVDQTKIEKGKNTLQQLRQKAQLMTPEKLAELRKSKGQLVVDFKNQEKQKHGYTEINEAAKKRVKHLVQAVLHSKKNGNREPVEIPQQPAFQSRFKSILNGLFPDGSIVRTNKEAPKLFQARSSYELSRFAQELVRKYPPAKVTNQNGEIPDSYVQSVILGRQKEERNKNAITA